MKRTLYRAVKLWVLPVGLGLLTGVAVHFALIWLGEPPPPSVVHFPQIPFPGDTVRVTAVQATTGMCFIWITEGSDAFGNVVAGSPASTANCESGIEFTIPPDLRSNQEFFVHFSFVDDRTALEEAGPVQFWGYRTHQIQINRKPEAYITIYPSGTRPPNTPPMGESWRSNALFAFTVLFAYLISVVIAAWRFSRKAQPRKPIRGELTPNGIPGQLDPTLTNESSSTFTDVVTSLRSWSTRFWPPILAVLKVLGWMIGFLAALATIFSFLRSL